MSIKILAFPEPLLKEGYYVGMIPPGPGGWGDKYPSKWYQVTFTEQILRDYRAGYMPASPSPDVAVTIDPDDDIGLQPRYYSTIYQCRIGVSPDWLCYIRWPTNEYRGALEEPDYAPVPAEAAAPWRRYIGFIDSKMSPISSLMPDDPDNRMRFEQFFIRDWMPIYHAYVNGIEDYVKLIMRFLVNKCTIEAVTDKAIRDKLDRKEIPYKPVFHYSVYVARAEGITT